MSEHIQKLADKILAEKGIGAEQMSLADIDEAMEKYETGLSPFYKYMLIDLILEGVDKLREKL